MNTMRLLPRCGYRLPLRRAFQTAATPNSRAADFAFAFE
jgi:hypothetical protein